MQKNYDHESVAPLFGPPVEAPVLLGSWNGGNMQQNS